MSKKRFFGVAIISSVMLFTVQAFGQTFSKTETSQRPRPSNLKKSPKKVDNIFLEGGNDSWNTRKKPTKPVRNLELENGGLETTNEAPEFGTGQRKTPPTRPVVIEDHFDMIGVRKLPKSVKGRQTVRRKKSKKAQNLLPYIEQDNLYRKRKQMKALVFSAVLSVLFFNAGIFGQSSPKQRSQIYLPEVNDEVLLKTRQNPKQRKTVSSKKSPGKYANQETSYRSKSKFRKVKGVTHDPEFADRA